MRIIIRQQTKGMQKAQLCLRLSLYRLDSLIHESNEILIIVHIIPQAIRTLFS